MKYFVYCRKSTDREDRQILGTEAQKRLLTEHAERHGLEVVEVFVENQSAYKTGRPLFNGMLARLEGGEAQGVLTYHLTRLARNSLDGGRLIYMMDEGRIRQIATPERAYTNNGDDKFLMQIHFAMAKKSSDDTSQFVRRDVESKLLKGEYPGMVPPGYLNINRDGHITRKRDDPQKYLLLLKLGRPLRREEIDPVEGPLVRQLFEEAARNVLPLAGLTRHAHALGLRAGGGKRLSKTAVYNLLTNPYYHGAIRYKGRLYIENVQHEPLVSRDLFERVQEALGTRRKGRYRRHLFAFGGCTIRCGRCGGPVTAERQKGHVYYHCAWARRRCPKTSWCREEALTAQLESIFEELRLPETWLEYALQRLRRCHQTEADLAAARRRQLQAQANACQARLDGLLQLKISPGNASGELLSDQEYLQQKTAIRQDLDEAQRHLEAERCRGDVWLADVEGFFRFTQGLAGRFGGQPAAVKRDVLGLVCSKLVLTNGKLDAVFHEPFAVLAGFPLAGKRGKRRSEPNGWLPGGENPEIMQKWLGILDAIRTGWLAFSAPLTSLGPLLGTPLGG